MKILKIENETISDGIGLRTSIYFSGCLHECFDCHNPQSWDPKNGVDVDENLIEKIIADYNNNPLLNGFTLTGGDPFFNVEFLEIFLKKIRFSTKANIWVYTGYVFEEIKHLNVLNYIDVLIDGRFEKSLYNPNLVFKGSSNQKIIDVKKSLKENKVIEIL